MSTVRQKLMKLFVDVRDGSWPEVAFAVPSCAKLEEMTPGSNARRENISALKRGRIHYI